MRDEQTREDGAPTEPRLDRLRLLSVALPLAYVVGVVSFLALNPFPSWASALVAVGVTTPLVVAFAVFVFRVVNTMREGLVRREQRITSLIEAAPDGIVIADDRGVIVMVNEQAERMFGYGREDLLGKHVEILMPTALRERHVGHRDGYASFPARRPMGAGLQLVGRRQDGTEFPVEISLSPITQEDGLLVNAVIRDITERQALEDERASLKAERDTQRERERIAMDLHDGIIQSVYAVTLGLEATMADIVDQSPEALRTQLERTLGQLDEVTRDIRSYIFELHPPRIDDALPDALKLLTDEFRVNTLITTTLEVDHDVPDIPEAPRLAAYHIAQEALNNARKHARATCVRVSLCAKDRQILLDVNDNGSGFDPGAARSGDHHGLANMAARAQAAGSRLNIETRPGEGTAVRLEIPMDTRED